MEEHLMPIINIQLTASITENEATEIAQRSTRIMGEILEKDTSLTAVAITKIEKQHWFINNTSLSNNKTESALVNVKISQNSNSTAQKSAAISAFYSLLDEIAGPLDNTSYVALEELPITDWGYGGKTQAARKTKRTETGAVDTEYYIKQGKKQRAKSFLNLLQSI